MKAARARVVASACLVPVLLVACTGSDPTASEAGGRPSSVASAEVRPGAAPTGAPPSATASPVAAANTPGAPAPGASSSGLVERPGAAPPSQRVPGPVVAFDQPAAYADGLSVLLRDIRHGTSTDTGIGAQADVPTTTLVVEVRNGTPSPVDLNGVVLTVTAGPDDALADPVYGGDQQDLTGVVPSGGRAQGTYSFEIPERARGDVTLSMDVDGRHLPAVWRGAVT